MRRNRVFVFATAVLIAGAAWAASPKNIFVSTDPTWMMPGMTGITYTDLQTALNAVGAGDTVWIQDGFVCQSGHWTSSRLGIGSYARVCLPNAVYTVRSESGYVDEAHGKGATIRGARDPESESQEYGYGDNAIFPLQVGNSSIVVQGLILENGVTSYSHRMSGGAVYGGGIFSNCVVRNCSSFAGGAFGGDSVTCYNCVVTNNFAFTYPTGYGGGAVDGNGHYYGCLFANNGTLGMGSAIHCYTSATHPPYYSNCTFRANGPDHSGYLAYFRTYDGRASFIDCTFNGNNGGLSGVLELRGCVFTNNGGLPVAGVEKRYDSGVWTYNWEGGRAIVSDCAFTNNVGSGYGGAINWAIASNCTLVANRSLYDGGGAYKSHLVNCQIVGNVCSNYNTGATVGIGGGLAYCTATNCVIVGNRVWSWNLAHGGNGGGAACCDLSNCVLSNNWSAYRGAAVYNPDRASGPYCCYNCLIVGNTSDAPHVGYDRGMILEGEGANTLATNPARFYNCTIVGNSAPSYAIMNDVELYNCIVWNNTAPLGEFYSGQVWAKYTCQKDLEEGTDDHNICHDPRLGTDYQLVRPRPCANVALRCDWMTDKADPRSKDLAGRARIIGSGPDLGCYEREVKGLIFCISK